jgi:hypothetical protein
MTENSLNQGLAMLLTLWPHRATDASTVALLRSLYHEALAELSDDAWLLACRAAVRACIHFPMPAELLDLAGMEAERSMNERHLVNEQRRLQSATVGADHLLTAGTLTPEQIAERKAWYDNLIRETKQAMNDADERRRVASARDYWARPRRRRRGIQLPDGTG